MSEGGDGASNGQDELLRRVGGKLVHKGPIVSVRMDTFEYPDGTTSTRQVVVHPGSVAIVAHDGKVLYMVRQPREPVGEASLLELPAGKLDKEGETPLECAQRELAEEIGKAAGRLARAEVLLHQPRVRDRAMSPVPGDGALRRAGRARGGERIEIVRMPLDELDAAIERCDDAKSLVGLLMLRRTT